MISGKGLTCRCFTVAAMFCGGTWANARWQRMGDKFEVWNNPWPASQHPPTLSYFLLWRHSNYDVTDVILPNFPHLCIHGDLVWFHCYCDVMNVDCGDVGRIAIWFWANICNVEVLNGFGLTRNPVEDILWQWYIQWMSQISVTKNEHPLYLINIDDCWQCTFLSSWLVLVIKGIKSVPCNT